MPANHSEPGFYEPFGESGGHAELANEDFEAYTAARAGLEEPHTDAPMYEQLAHMPPVAAVGYCQTCHNERVFCDGCHGVQMPHPRASRRITARPGVPVPRCARTATRALRAATSATTVTTRVPTRASSGSLST
jgi:hypothetical protein